ncbi:16S rRNA (guanine(966)-N(2))-methyltransferase RsmD [Candidatus Thiodictyon syntrophicum]|uniref:16S rRNA (guanine(966)-N(2))-methyltransferase RsmD n=1 Tax=Candidatus Thiodictyon syntrophicum TaxID=1166950 RepID=UPI001F0080C2|nr:16S rRNA (guanine(966)-N(2))-methyltransferase RsmD [Candidatus Thiodictyon syntrophicum]
MGRVKGVAGRSGPGHLRIIGGRNRGRRLPIPDQPGLRPTADRVRETLFNWLTPVLPGARCLDLFAGSGALGLEAASRGAGRVVLVERNAAVARQLLANVETLAAANVEVIAADALAWLAGEPRPFDIVFLDPPFADGLLAPACALLDARGWLAPGARVYLESAERAGFPALPQAWELVREGTAGQVRYGLALVRGGSSPPPG